MFEKIKIGIALAKQTLNIIKKQKRFLLFPLMNFVLIILFFCITLLPALMILGKKILPLLSDQHNHLWSIAFSNADNTTFTLLTILFVFLSVMSTIFISSALTLCTAQYLDHEKTSVITAFKIISQRIGKLIVWGVINTIISIVMFGIESVLSNRSQVLANLADGLEKTAWMIISFFVLPIILLENLNAFSAIKRSGGLLKKTWGSALVSCAGLGLLIFAGILIAITPTALAIHFQIDSLILPAVLFTVIVVFALLLLNATLQTVLRTALYLFAIGKNTQPFYDTDLLQGAFKNHLRK